MWHQGKVLHTSHPFKPSAFYAADYCAYPVTSSEAQAARASIGVGFRDPFAANNLEG